MEWNTKWDWENLVMCNLKAVESPKKLQQTDWRIEEEEELDAVSFNLSGGGGGSGCGSGGSDSVLGLGSSTKSSVSASTDSSMKVGMKTSNITIEGFEAFPGDFNKKREFYGGELIGTSSPLEGSVGSGESLIGLKLGKRTYFENNCGGGAKTSSFSVIPVSSDSTAKKTKLSCQSTTPTLCQVDGCNLDLSAAKEYHRKHKVCESHSKCPKVTVRGLERRFCQQCSRFHNLSEFDEKKRSCRRRLSDHNARRRKPQQETFQFDSTRLPSSLYGARRQMSLELNNIPLVHARPTTNPTWESTCRSTFTVTEGCQRKQERAGGIEGQPHFLGAELPQAINLLNLDSNMLLPCKGIANGVFDQGLKGSTFSSNMDAAPNLRSALSLLSTNSSSSPSECVTFERHMHVDQTSIPLPVMRTMPQSLPIASSECWQTEKQSTDFRMLSFTTNSNDGNYIQEAPLVKAPYATGFYTTPLN